MKSCSSSRPHLSSRRTRKSNDDNLPYLLIHAAMHTNTYTYHLFRINININIYCIHSSNGNNSDRSELLLVSALALGTIPAQ